MRCADRKVGGPVSRIRRDEWGGAAAAAVDTGMLFSMLEMNEGPPHGSTTTKRIRSLEGRSGT